MSGERDRENILGTVRRGFKTQNEQPILVQKDKFFEDGAIHPKNFSQ